MDDDFKKEIEGKALILHPEQKDLKKYGAIAKNLNHKDHKETLYLNYVNKPLVFTLN